MALVTITGFPCSGKSRRVDQIRAHLETRLTDPGYTGPHVKVKILSDDTLNITRSVYDGNCQFIDAPIHLAEVFPCPR